MFERDVEDFLVVFCKPVCHDRQDESMGALRCHHIPQMSPSDLFAKFSRIRHNSEYLIL